MKLFIATLLACVPAFAEPSYQVPVPDDLKEYAQYPIKDVQVTPTSVSYTLPLELTGTPNKIVLEAKGTAADGSYTRFEGPKGVANCNDVACNVRYRNLELDPTGVRQNLLNEGFQGKDLTKRLQVFAAFSGDPAGIIRLK